MSNIRRMSFLIVASKAYPDLTIKLVNGQEYFISNMKDRLTEVEVCIKDKDRGIFTIIAKPYSLFHGEKIYYTKVFKLAKFSSTCLLKTTLKSIDLPKKILRKIEKALMEFTV